MTTQNNAWHSNITSTVPIYSIPNATGITLPNYSHTTAMIAIGTVTLTIDDLLDMYTSKVFASWEVKDAILDSIKANTLSLSDTLPHIPFLVDANIFSPDDARTLLGLQPWGLE